VTAPEYPPLRLTDREVQILYMLTTRAMRPDEVADELGIAPSTVRQRVRDAMRRNGFRDRFALGLRLVHQDEVELIRSDHLR